MHRRHLLVASASAAVLSATSPSYGQPVPVRAARSFVLVHGSWHGAWCWDRTAQQLRMRGHRVYAVTQTGLGDRQHLLGAANHIDVYVNDIVNLIEAEELDDVVLVGHSFGGIPVTGAAARLSGRISSLVYLDAGVPRSGESALSPLSPEEQALRRKAVVPLAGVDVLMPPSEIPRFWGLNASDSEWVKRRLTPHPFATYATPLRFDDAAWERLPRTYVQCTAPWHPALGAMQARLREDRKWRWIEFAAGHDGMVTHPQELAEILAS